MKYQRSVALFTTASLLLASCGTSSHSNEKILDIELPLKTTSIAPFETDVPVRVGAAETLFKVSKNGEIQPWLAQSYHYNSSDQLEIKLKDHIHFQNGVPLTGEKVKKV